MFVIVLYKNGPFIENINSIYLKYKTLPIESRSDALLEVNMIVSLSDMKEFPFYSFAYVIEKILNHHQYYH